MSNISKYLLSFLLVIHTHCDPFTFKETKLEIDPSNYSEELFKDLTYDSFLSMQKNLNPDPKLVHTKILEEEYPDLAITDCGDSPCQTIMYEITNQQVSLQKQKTLPTILLVGGFHGTETLGIQALMRFIQIMPTLYELKTEIYKMFNNNRILIIPVINMNGFYQGSDLQDSPTAKGMVESDIYMDFNLNPASSCFISLGAQFLQKIYNENVIFGTLAFTKGNFTLDLPIIKKLTGSQKLTNDEIILNKILYNLSLVYIDDKDLSFMDDLDNFDVFDDDIGDFPELRMEHGTVTGFQWNLGEMADGRYIDWAFAGSEEKSLIQTSCLGGGKDYGLTKEDITPNNESNRAMAVEVGLDKQRIKDIDTALGNELACIDASIPGAKVGVVSSLVMMLRQFVQILNPYVSLEKIEYEPEVTTREVKGEEIRFYMEYFGVMTFPKAKIKDPKILLYKASAENQRMNNKSKGMVFSAFYKKENALDRSKPLTFTFDLKFFNDFKQINGVSDTGITHYLKYRRDASYSSKLKKSNIELGDPSNFQIRGVQLDNLHDLLLFEQSNNFSTLLPQTPLMIQFGSYFPIELIYDKELGSLSYEILKDNIPSHKKENKLTDVSVQTGFFNILNDSRSNQHFLNRLSGLNRNPEDVEISFYSGDASFVCSVIRTDTYRKNILKQEIPAKGKSNKNLLKSQNTTNEKSDDFKSLEKLCASLMKGNFEENVRNSMRFKISKGTSVPMISTIFLNMAGQRVNLRYSADQLEEKGKKALDNGEVGKQGIELNGLIVATDPAITGTPDTKHETNLPTLKEFTSQKKTKFLPFPLTSLSCDSFSPYLPIESPLIREAALKRIQLKRPIIQPYFHIMIERQEDSNKNVLITLLTTRRNSMDMFILYNKQSSFTLKKISDKYTEAQRKSGKSLLYTYQGLYPKDDLALLGLYIMIGEKGDDEKLFDCFLSQNKIGMKNSHFYFQVYQGINHEIEEIVRKAMAPPKAGFLVHLKWIMIGTGVVLALCIAVGVVVFLVKWDDKQKDDGDEGKEEGKEEKEEKKEEVEIEQKE